MENLCSTHGEAQKVGQKDYHAENKEHKAGQGILCGSLPIFYIWSGAVGVEREGQEPVTSGGA